MSDQTKTVLSLEGVSKFFPGVKALDRVNLTVREGEVHGLVGENGAGKSTLMAVASGAMQANEGQVTIAGLAVSADPEQIRDLGLAIVRQEPLLMPDLTVSENIYLGLPPRLRPPVARMRAFATEALNQWSAETGISPDDRVQALNPEKRFIVEIVKALSADIRVLILDEPTEHLIAEDVQRLFSKIRDLTSKGAAVVYISHRIKEVQAIADRLTVLRDGQSIGTYDANGLSEEKIIELIVGMSLESEFPAKAQALHDASVVLSVDSFSGAGFQNVSLNLHKGEILGLAGIDANGQREFLRGLAGLNPGRGKLEINGQLVSVGSARDAISVGINYLPGDRHREGMVADLSVRENFTMRSMGEDERILFLSRSSEETRTQRAVREFAVKTPTLETKIESLSGGNQQKLILASVLAGKPRVLLVDEPTQGVDVGARAEIYRKLREIAEAGVAIIVVSSDATEIAGLCDRVMIFSRGSIVERLTDAAVTDGNITSAFLKSTSVRQRHHSQKTRFVDWAAGDWAPTVMVALAVIGMGIFATIVNPSYLSPRGLSGMMLLVAALAFVSYGQQLLLLVGGIDLSVGPLMGLAGVVGSFFLTQDAGTGTQITGWMAVAAVCMAVGLLNYGLIEIIKLHSLIATLATYMGLQAVSLLLRPVPDGMVDFDILDGIGYKLGFVPISFIIAVIVGLALEFILFRSRLGITLRGQGSRPEAARLMGISQTRIRLLAYVGCSTLTGLAAVLMIGQVGIGDARAGIGYTLTSIAAAVIGGASLFGGRGSFIGSLFGAILIIQVNQVTSFIRLDTAWASFLLGGMILVAVTFYSTARKKVVSA